MQISARGKLDYPAIVSREDVAELAVAASLFAGTEVNNATESTSFTEMEAFHMTLAARWAGACQDSMPSQGRKKDGQYDAFLGMSRILKGERRRRRVRQKAQRPKEQSPIADIVQAVVKTIKPRRRLKPYGILAAASAYLLMAMTLRCVLVLPGVRRISTYVATTFTTFAQERLSSRWAALVLWIGSCINRGGNASKYINL